MAFSTSCMTDSQKKEFKKEYHMEDLHGDYTGGELKDILAHRDEGKPLGSKLRRKMEDAGDTQYF